MSDARKRLEAAGSKITKTDDGKYLVTDPRWPDAPQGPWDESQIEGWANAQTTDPQLVAVSEPPAQTATSPDDEAPAKISKAPAKSTAPKH